MIHRKLVKLHTTGLAYIAEIAAIIFGLLMLSAYNPYTHALVIFPLMGWWSLALVQTLRGREFRGNTGFGFGSCLGMWAFGIFVLLRTDALEFYVVLALTLAIIWIAYIPRLVAANVSVE